jgi:hypothetical protein
MAFDGRMSKCHGLSDNVQGSYKYTLCKPIMGHCVMCLLYAYAQWNLEFTFFESVFWFYLHLYWSRQTSIKTMAYFPAIHICTFYPIPWLCIQVEQKSVILSLFNQRKHWFFSVTVLYHLCHHRVYKLLCGLLVVWAEWSIARFFGAWGQVMTMGAFNRNHEL